MYSQKSYLSFFLFVSWLIEDHTVIHESEVQLYVCVLCDVWVLLLYSSVAGRHKVVTVSTFINDVVDTKLDIKQIIFGTFPFLTPSKCTLDSLLHQIGVLEMYQKQTSST